MDCADSTRGSCDNCSTSRGRDALLAACMTKQSTPRAGMGQSLVIVRPYWLAIASAIRRRAFAPARGVTPGARVVAAPIVHVGTKVRRRQTQHHQDLPLSGRVVDQRAGGAI